MKNFSILFFFAYVILKSALNLLLQSGSGFILSIVVTIATSCLVAANFSNKRKRRPTAKETSAYAWQATLALWAAATIMTIGSLFLAPDDYARYFFISIARPLAIFVTLVTIPVSSLFYYVVIRWSFSWCTQVLQPAFTETART